LDSHEDMPRDERSREELLRVNLYPFQQAINEGIEMHGKRTSSAGKPEELHEVEN
jgi:hypothetical protein